MIASIKFSHGDGIGPLPTQATDPFANTRAESLAFDAAELQSFSDRMRLFLGTRHHNVNDATQQSAS
jgi:hypothetical protein